MKREFILAIDQGSGSSRAVVFNRDMEIISMAQKEIAQINPKPGWVEYNPEEIYSSVIYSIKKALSEANIRPQEIKSIGVTNQTETVILWNRKTGKPLYNAISWQCCRTAPMMESRKKRGLEPKIKEKTGLVLNPSFSASKINWILENISGIKKQVKAGEVLFGNVDTWLLWSLSREKIHITSASNASGSMIFNINKLCWDSELLCEFNIPISILPEVRSSSEVYGVTDPKMFGAEIPLASNVGDMQASLLGQACFQEGMAKCTHGTGSFILLNVGNKPLYSDHGALTYIAWTLKGTVTYALVGFITVAGGALQWLCDQLGLIKSLAEVEELATKVNDNGGVYFVPAFAGLGTPYWDMYARALMIGMTPGTTKAHIIRAVLESIVYQVSDVIEAIEVSRKQRIKCLRVDGGCSKNNFIMQFQADMLKIPVQRSSVRESSALGSALLAGLAINYWKSLLDIQERFRIDRTFYPKIKEHQRQKLYVGWKKAVNRAMAWKEPQNN